MLDMSYGQQTTGQRKECPFAHHYLLCMYYLRYYEHSWLVRHYQITLISLQVVNKLLIERNGHAGLTFAVQVT